MGYLLSGTLSEIMPSYFLKLTPFYSGMQVSGLRLSMVKVNTVKDAVLFAVPDVPKEHQEQRGMSKCAYFSSATAIRDCPPPGHRQESMPNCFSFFRNTTGNVE
jgi:hypothetical protein